MGGVPETLYVRDGDVYLAYQVLGDRGPDLLFVPGPTFPIDLIWDEPAVAGCLRRLASFTRLILTTFSGAGVPTQCRSKTTPRCSLGPTA